MNFLSIGSLRDCNCINLHLHNIWEIVYYTKGSLTLTVGEESYELTEGVFTLLPPVILHGEKSSFGFCNFHISMKENFFLPGSLYIVKDTEDRSIRKLTEILMHTYYTKGENYQNKCESLLNTILQFAAGQQSSIKESGKDIYIKKFIRIVADNISNPDFKIADAMKQIPFSADYFRILFEKHSGLSPQKYLLNARIKKAMQLMDTFFFEKGLAVKDIATMCGFADPLYFSRAFKKSVGSCPNQWTKRK